MTITIEEIIDIIRENCYNHDNCFDCPLRKHVKIPSRDNCKKTFDFLLKLKKVQELIKI